MRSTITDAFVQNLETVKARIAANLRDLGDDESAAARVYAVRRSRRGGA